jgi:DNA (cytosine-5)-methyltransferase 1
MDWEQISLFDLTLPTFKVNKPIRLIEFFAGIGSQAMALRDLGVDFEHHKVIEFDKYAIASYNAIHNTNFETADIRKVKGIDLGITDVERFTYLLTYSFPCQDISVAGKRKGFTSGSGTRSGLLWEVERILNELDTLPQVLLMENVSAVHSEDNMADFQLWIDFLASKGYSNYWQDLNARDYGVAQNRDRCFMVSILGEYNYKFPKPIPLEKTMKDYLEDNVDDKYYIKSEKADKLIQQLIKDGTLEDIDNAKGINLEDDGTCRTIKSQYFKTSTANFDKNTTFGATGVVETTPPNSSS